MGKEVLIEMSKDEANNLNHRYSFKDTRNNIDFSYFIKDDFSFRRFIENEKGIQNPDSITLTLELKRRVEKTVLTQKPLGEIMFDEYEPIKNFIFNNNPHQEEEFDSMKLVDIYAPIISLVRKGDLIEITDYAKDGTDLNFNKMFEGYVTNINVRYENLYIYFDLTIEDITYKGFDTEFVDNEFYKDKYIYNNNDLNNSLLFMLLKKIFIGLTDNEIKSKINIPNIVYPDNSYRKVLFTQWKKGEKIYKHIAQLVDSFGGKIYMDNDILTVKNPLGNIYNNSYTDMRSYIYGDNNILNSISEKTYTNYNEVKITYNQFEVANKQKIFQLMGAKGTENEGEANVTVNANTSLIDNKNYFDVNFISDMVMSIDPLFKTLAHYYTIEGDETSKVTLELVSGVHYTIDYTEVGGKIKFGNPLAYKLFIDTFIIYGEPIMTMNGNTYNYTKTEIISRDSKIYELKEINPYIQNAYEAEILAKWLYFNNCLEKTELEFTSNIITPLNTNTVVTVNHIDFVGEILITDITHNSKKSSIKALKFYPFNLSDFTGGQAQTANSTDYNIMKGLDYIKEETIIIDPTKPIAPQNVVLESTFGGFYVKWETIPNRSDIKAYWVNVRYVYNGVVSNSNYQSLGNYVFVKAQYLKNSDNSVVEYEITINAVTFKGVEGTKSAMQKVIPIKAINSSDVEYPVGMSPSDLNTKITANTSSLTTLNSELTTAKQDIVTLNNNLNDINFNELKGSISANQIVGAIITGDKIASRTITANSIVADSITANEIATNAITANEINAGAITTDKIFANAITAGKIASKTITASEIATGTITASEIATGTITANEIKGATITGDKLVANTITASKIATETITANEIKALTITGDKIVANTITSDKINVTNLLVKNVEILNNSNFLLMKENDLNGKLIIGAKNVSLNGGLNPIYSDIQFQIGDDSGFNTDSYIRYNSSTNKFETKLEELDLRYTLGEANLGSNLSSIELSKYYYITIPTINTTTNGRLLITLGGVSNTLNLTTENLTTSYNVIIYSTNTNWLSVTAQGGWIGTYGTPTVKEINPSKSIMIFRDIDGNISSELKIFPRANFNNAIGLGVLRLNTAGIYNVGFGSFSLNNNTTGSFNTSIGGTSLVNNTTGNFNTAIGYNSLRWSVSGDSNVAIGYQNQLYSTTGKTNVSVGYNNLINNTAGYDNISIGNNCNSNQGHTVRNITIGRDILQNTTSSQNNIYIGDKSASQSTGVGGINGLNVGIGQNSLRWNNGEGNVAIGHNSAYYNDTGTGNVTLGYEAGSGSGANYKCISIGYRAMNTSTSYSNSIAIGQASQVTGSNQAQIGDSSVTTYVYGTVQNRSDKRDKTDIKDSHLGLDFILNLKPVIYKWDMREDYVDNQDLVEGFRLKDGSKKRGREHSGFIAQDVKNVMTKLGVDFGGYQDHSINGGLDVLSLGYDEFIAPMVKAIQELSDKVNLLEEKLSSYNNIQ